MAGEGLGGRWATIVSVKTIRPRGLLNALQELHQAIGPL
jgi:hypothetical protein